MSRLRYSAAERAAIREAIRGVAWPGGYVVHAVTDDGGALCSRCVRWNLRRILRADPRDGFRVAGASIHWEGAAIACDHCGAEIPSEYGEIPDPDHKPAATVADLLRATCEDMARDGIADA